jgi:hypothetical protein
MRHFSSLRRLALGVAITGTALSAVPAVANASSACTYGLGGPAGLFQTATVTDGSGSSSLRITRAGPFIAVADGSAVPRICTGPTGVQATVTNTDFIVVNGTPTSGSDDFIVDQRNGAFAPGLTRETDGTSELETLVGTNSLTADLVVRGTDAADVMRVGVGGGVMLGSDLDTDVRLSRARTVTVTGGGGNDFLSGRGGAPAAPAPSTVPVFLVGDAGNDTVVDGLAENDDISGGSGEDVLFSNDGLFDFVTGQTGFDRATVDTEDGINGTANAEIESYTLTSVGHLRLAPGVLKAEAGKTALLKMRWTTPKSWRDLRKVELSLYRDGKVVGRIKASPARARLTARGVVDLKATACKLTRHGKTVTATLAFRLPKSLAGQNLRVDVQATDRHGHEQLEPGAGLIQVG